MISIVIPTWNQNEMTAECISAIRQCTKGCEIIVVDNGSAPAFTKPYAGFVDVIVLRNEENAGFPAAVNQGVLAARGDTIILLNNDVVVTPGWADVLVGGLKDYAIVGPVTNYCMGMQRVQIGAYDNQGELNKAAAEWAEANAGHYKEVRWVIGFCMAFRRSLYDEIGPFDETLWPCCGEEIDYCLRAGIAGHRTGIAAGCYVHHEGSVTFKALDGTHSYHDIVDRNNKYLEDRWGKDWNNQEVDRSVKPNGLSLNLGCGDRQMDGFVNIDNRAEVYPDLVCDVTDGLPYEDGSVDLVRADDFLEHIPPGKVIPLMNEIWRVLKPGGVFESNTPSTDGRGAFQDPTHLSFWNRNSWDYYSTDKGRALYRIKADFVIDRIEDIDTDPARMVIHTHVVARARK